MFMPTLCQHYVNIMSTLRNSPPHQFSIFVRRFALACLAIIPTSVLCERYFSNLNAAMSIARTKLSSSTLEAGIRISGIKEARQEPEAGAKATKRAMEALDLRELIKPSIAPAPLPPRTNPDLIVYTSQAIRPDVAEHNKLKRNRGKSRGRQGRALKRQAAAIARQGQ